MSGQPDYPGLVLSAVEEMLGRSDPALSDDFFLLGGDSVLALRTISLLESKTGIKLSLQRFVSYQTLAEIAEALAAESADAAATLPTLDEEPNDGVIFLRPWSADSPNDLATLRSGSTDPYVVEIEHVPSPFSEEAALGWIARKHTRRAKGQGFDFAIVDIKSGETVGGISVSYRHVPGTAEIGSWIAPEWRGKKMVSRANRLMAEWTLTAHTGVERLEALVEPDVIAPQKVWEGLGFTKEGLLRSAVVFGERRGDVIIYSLLRDEVIPGRGFGQPLN